MKTTPRDKRDFDAYVIDEQDRKDERAERRAQAMMDYHREAKESEDAE